MVRRVTTAHASGESGAAALEFALVAPAFLLMVLGLVYFSLVVWMTASLQYAAEDAARCARAKTIICTDATAITAYAQSHYYAMGRPAFAYSKQACGNRVTGSVSTPAAFMGFGSNAPLTAAACFP
jgi:hypothetical protein